MVTKIKIKTIELELSANVVVPGGSVQLTANLSDRELDELKAQGGEIKFSVDEKQDYLQVDPNDPRSATWRAPSEQTPVGVHSAKVELFLAGEPIATEEANIYVVKTTTLTMKIKPQSQLPVDEGQEIILEVVDAQDTALTLFESPTLAANLAFDWDTGNEGAVKPDPKNQAKAVWYTDGMNAGAYPVTARLVDKSGLVLASATGPLTATGTGTIKPSAPAKGDTLRVALQRSSAVRTRDQALWSLIRSCTSAISGNNYIAFIDRILCPEPVRPISSQSMLVKQLSRDARGLDAYGVGAYALLKTATQVFLLLECGGCHAEIKDLDVDQESARFGETISLQQITDRLQVYLSTGHLPYLDRVVKNAFRGQKEITRPHCFGLLTSRIQVPCLLELIWSYWHEEGMLVQSINAIARRFQNIRAPGGRDPLAHLEIDPLRPLSNLLWGYIQDEKNLLTVKRRAYEYDHQYGLSLYGKAVPVLRPADSRSKFLEAFHHLLHRCSLFYKEDNDTTVIADGFALLNALKEVHLLLAEGASNQFGDLPWTARGEMLIQQWLMSRPEMRDFLQGRRMVPYREPWMAQVDTMKALQGWTDIPVTHFRDLGVYGEQILLTIRYGDWIDINNEDDAKNWARSWRPEIQSYLHAYRAVTGMDLTNRDTVDHTLPAIHLQKRLAMQRAR
jgi:hypothetical protein